MRDRFFVWLCAAALLLPIGRSAAANVLNWNTNQDRVTADIHSVPVPQLLASIALHAGWHVYLESNITYGVSAKFQDLQQGEALRMLLGDLNFALVPQTNGPQHLYVFRTSIGKATQVISPADLISKKIRSAKIPNELVVTLKPGVKVDDLACVQNGKVTGRIDPLHTYRVQFKDEAAAEAAKDCLANNPDVQAVENNYSMEKPNAPLGVLNQSPNFTLTPRANNGENKVIVGLVDTSVGTLGNGLDQFLLPAISAAGDSPASSQLTHGTAMAETILEAIQQNTDGQTGVKLLPVDVYGGNETTSSFDVTKGIYDAYQGGANIINLSLGGQGDSQFMHTLIQQMSDQGVLFVAAAGNQPVTTPEFPAAYPEVMAVTASSAPGVKAPYANYGSFVDFMLPGTSIVPWEGQSWAVTGTSTSTAFATGILAGFADAHHDPPKLGLPFLQSKFSFHPGNGQ